jgi:uncharacterized protein YjbI with pentapeptide repeats
MKARRYSWRQGIEQHPVRLAVIIGAATLGIALLVVLVLGYIFNWDWTGLNPYIPPTKDSNFQRGKTLWDWLQLIFVPAILTLGAVWFTARQNHAREIAEEQHAIAERQMQTDRNLAMDNQHEAVLHVYIDKMSELLLVNHLRESNVDEEVRKIARVRTLTVLHNLDPLRKRNVLLFLHESYHIDKKVQIIDLSGADLSGANLSEADLGQAHLGQAHLNQALLVRADLSGAYLAGAHLNQANLSGAKVTDEQLAKARSLEGTTMPDGSKHT